MTWVSKEEQAKAKQHDLLSYMQQAERDNLVKVSTSEYATKEHSSLKISNGMWHWWSRGEAGKTAVDYLIKVKGYSFPDAVKEVNRVMEGIEPSFSLQPKAEGLKIPEKDEDNEAAIEYLKARCIDENIIKEQMEKGTIYQSGPYGNVNFVGFNSDGKPQHISYRSTRQARIRGDSRGSDKRYCFRSECAESETVHVFESAIDLLSFATLAERDGRDYRSTNLISLSGTGGLALDHFLKENPAVKNVVLHLDNDDAGRKASIKLKGNLVKKSYNVYDRPPDFGKDYNDFLRHSMGVSEPEFRYEAAENAGIPDARTETENAAYKHPEMMSEEAAAAAENAAQKGAESENKMNSRNEKQDKKPETLEVIYIEPGREPKLVKIDDTLEKMQELVGGSIEVYMPYEYDVGFVVNEEGRVKNLEHNRAVRDENGHVVNIIDGPFFITFAPVESESFLPLPDDKKEKYLAMFKTPQCFINEHGKVRVLPARQPENELER